MRTHFFENQRKVKLTTLVAIVMSLLLSACSVVFDNFCFRPPLTFTATIETATKTNDTKTTYDPGSRTAFWSFADKISLTAITGTAAQVQNHSFSLSSGSGTKSGTFSEDNLSTIWPLEEEATYVAVYPYKSDITFVDEKMHLNYSHNQNVLTTDFSCGVMVSCITQTGFPTSLPFKNIFSIIKMSLTGTGTINKITFKDLSGRPVSGSYTVAVAETESTIPVPVFPDFPSTLEAQSIELGLSLTLSSEPQFVYLAVPPREYTNGFEYIFETTDGDVMTKTIIVPTTLAPSYIYSYSTSLPFTKDSNTYLSDKGTANSYIVSESGAYSFLATVIGNGVPGLIPQLEPEQTQYHTDIVGISPSSAKILWQDVENLLTDVQYAQGKVTFTASSLKGNAVIAVYDNSNPDAEDANILWSWHIWCTDAPVLQDYLTSEGNHHFLFDRNLGATSSEPEETSDEFIQSQGLFYQWGRKDPFIGPQSIDEYSTQTLYDGQNTEFFDDYEPCNTIAYAIQHPTTLLGFSDMDMEEMYDWHCYEAATQPQQNNYLWAPQGKSLYDPCPPGYRVPMIDTWSNLGEPVVQPGTSIAEPESLIFFGCFFSNNTIWYPAAGCRGFGADPGPDFAGEFGYCWSSTFNDEAAASGGGEEGSEVGHGQVQSESFSFTLGSGGDTQGQWSILPNDRNVALPVRCKSIY